MSERITTVNLHTHTRRCKHARGIPADYAKAAEEKGIRVLGMTDHTPFPDDRVIIIRMGIAELDDYIREVREAQADYPKLKILLGLECEYFPEFDDFYRMLREEKKMDYLIGSVHFYMYKGKPKGFWNGFVMDREALQSYADAYTQMLESGHFFFGAHPDLFGAAIDTWNEDCEETAERICETAARLKMPLEINVSGWLKQEQDANKHGYISAEKAIADGISCPRPYPLDEFWRVAARHGVQAVINSDAHDPEVLTKYMELGYDMAERNGVEIIYPFGK